MEAQLWAVHFAISLNALHAVPRVIGYWTTRVSATASIVGADGMEMKMMSESAEHGVRSGENDIEARKLAVRLIEKIVEGAVSLTLSRMPEDEEDRVEQEIFEDVRACLVDEETGCLDPEKLDEANSTLLWTEKELTAASQRAFAEGVRQAAQVSESWKGRRLEGEYPNEEISSAFGRGVDMASHYIAKEIRFLSPQPRCSVEELGQGQIALASELCECQRQLKLARSNLEQREAQVRLERE